MSGIRALKKQVELHINEQFFNVWTCSTLVALPLREESLCNLKRFEAHLARFHHQLFEH